MPMMRKLTDDEVRDIENKGKGQRKLIEEEYDRFLAEYEVGDYGEAALGGDENRLTVRNRFKAAAARRGVGLEFRRATGDTLRFKVISRDDDGAPAESVVSNRNGRAQAATVETAPPTPQAPAKKKGGRPRKTA